MRLKLALIVVGVFAAIAVTGASAADFEHDEGPCHETPGEALLGRCPTGYVGVEYEIDIESEEGSGCVPYDYFELVNSSLPAGLSLSRDGVISGVPTSAGVTRFWLWDRDLTAAQGGPSWCQFEDKSEREFSIAIDPGLAIVNESVKPATIGQPYTETLTTKQVASLNPVTGHDVQATWSLESGALPAGVTLSTSGVLSGTPTSEGSFQFVVRAVHGSPSDTETYALTVRQPLSVKSPFGPARPPSSEVGIRLAKTFTATGGSGTYTWSLVVRRIALRGRARRDTRHDRGNAPEGWDLRVRRHRDGQRGARNHIRCCVDGCAATHDQDPPLEAREGREHVPDKAGNRRRRPAREVERC